MDKLKQVLKYQFWILLTVALILPFVGWTMATSGLSTEAAARTDELTKLNDSLKADQNDPNKDWEIGLEAINKDQAVQPKIAHKVLYERQLPLMTWPAKMPNDPTLFQTKHQEYYREIYRRGSGGQRPLIDEVRKIVNPYDEETQTGLVIYDEALLPIADTEWVSQAPSVKQIEAAQEDLWLLSSILKQIAEVNEDAGAKTQFEAPIRQIIELYLRGGSAKSGGGSASKAAAGGGGAGGGMGGGMGGGPMAKGSMGSMSDQMSSGGGMGGRSAGEGATAIASPKINPEDDLGPEVAAAADKPAGNDAKGGGGKGGAMGGAAMGGGAMGSGGGGMGGSGSGSSTRWSPSSMGRYRDDKPEFKTRGFYLEVLMDHRRIPELLASLANADWPITVLHVQEADFKDEDLADASGGLSSMGSRSMGGGAMGGGAMGPMGGGAMGPMGGGGRPPMGGGGTPGPRSGALKGPVRSSDEGSDAPTMTRSPLDDPNLANVAIVGVIYIFKKPTDAPGSTTSGSTTPGATAPATPAPGATGQSAPVAAAPATAGPAPTGDGAKTPPIAAQAESDAAADDAKGRQSAPAATDAPGKKPEEKPENQSEEGKAPDKDSLPEKAAPEKAGNS